jgi:Leucine-rich repeat (LRR) protein
MNNMNNIDFVDFVDYSNLKLDDLPSIEFDVKRLNIQNNKLRKLYSKLDHLEYLNCSQNLIYELPNYAKLLYLNCSQNNICVTSDKLLNLEFFNGSRNKLQKIFECPNINELHLQYNMIKELNVINNYDQLVVLDISHNPIESISVYLPNLLELHCSNCNLNELKANCFPKLQILICCENSIKSINNFINLIELNCSQSNKIAIYNLPSLNILIANECYFTEFPSFSTLKIAKLNKNYIENIPLINVHNLEILHIAYNKLTSFPFNYVMKLSELDISHNMIKHIDINKNIEKLSVEFNPLTTINLHSNLNLKELNIDFNSYKFLELNDDIVQGVDIELSKKLLHSELKKELRISDENINILLKYIINFNFNNYENELLILVDKILNTSDIKRKCKIFKVLDKLIKKCMIANIIIKT